MPGLSLNGHKVVGDRVLSMGRWMALHVADASIASRPGDEAPSSGTNYCRVDLLGKMSPLIRPQAIDADRRRQCRTCCK
jgi:hypothetical protein